MTQKAGPRIGKESLPVPVEAVPAPETEAEMRNVEFHVDPTVVLHIHDLRGQMFDKEKGKPLNLDNKQSFILRIFKANIGVTGSSLTELMNRYVFNYSGAPLRNIVIRVEDGHLVQEGVMHKVIDIPFRMTADVSATADGWIRIHPTRIEVLKLNGSAIMKVFDITLEEVLKKLPAGVRVEKNDLLIEPLNILPPPKIEGHLAHVRVDGHELLQVFDDGRNIASLQLPEAKVSNYMYFQKGTLRMGKLFMITADMMVIDTDQSDPFDFFLDQYNRQLVAGFNRNRADYGLTVYMRDFEDLDKPPRPGEKLAR